MKWLIGLMLCLMLVNTQAEQRPYLVLLPVAVDESDEALANEYGTQIQGALQASYRVFYGAVVETELENIYEKVEQQLDCDGSVCNREIALFFGSELIGYPSVKKIRSNYVASMQIRNVMSGETLFSKTLTCRDCDELQLLERLPELGQSDSNQAEPGSSIVFTDSAPVSSAGKSGSGEMAVLIIGSEPSGARVTINGKSAGVTPYQGLDHELGEQLTMTLELEHYLPQTMNISLNGPITKETVQLQPGQGELLVYTEPFLEGVKVSINGKEVGTAPYKVQLSAGVHQIGVITQDGQRGSTDFTVQHGELKKLRFNVKSPSTASSGSATPGKSDGKTRSYTVGGVDFKFVKIPEGSFMMGSNNGRDNEKPVHRVSISSFYMMEHEVTWSLYQQCIDAGSCPDNSGAGGDNGWGKGDRPVIAVSWYDITEQFIPWLNRKTGKTFRLPSESEWEYAARAGSTTKYSFGDSIDKSKANYGRNLGKTAPVKSYRANDFGLYDMHGNVWEWTQDCWNDSYNGAPGNNRAWESGNCIRRVLRGGSWAYYPTLLRSAYRVWYSLPVRDHKSGFRLVQAP